MGRILRLTVAALLVVTVLSVGSLAQAADPPTGGGNGLRVSPVRTDAVIQPGQKQVVTVTVTNVTNATASFQAIINDFTARGDESGNPALILDSNKFAPAHSLKRFVSPIKDITLQPGQQKDVEVVITIPANAAGGGYYGVVRFAPAGIDPEDDDTVSLASSVGSLILVKVPGDINEQLKLASFDVRVNDHARSLFTGSKDLRAVARFQNVGNVQTAPYGKILLKNNGGKVLGQYEVNNGAPQANVLPDSIRKFAVPLDKVGGFGRYKLEGNFGYGTDGKLLTASTTFFVIPLWMILGVLGLIIALALIIFFLRVYKKRILRKATRR